MIECYIYICRTWRERDADDWVWSRDLRASSAGLSNRISEKKPVKPVCPGLCLPECLETRNNGSRGGHTNYDYTMGTHDIVWGWCDVGRREGGKESEGGRGKRESKVGGGGEGWSDYRSLIMIWWKKRPVGKPTQRNRLHPFFLQMNQDTEKWPVFNQASSKQKSRSHESLAHKDSLPYLEEENSGMFTLKRKKDKEGNGKTTLAPNPQLPRTTSLGSKRDSTESKNRTSHGSIQTTLLWELF